MIIGQIYIEKLFSIEIYFNKDLSHADLFSFLLQGNKDERFYKRNLQYN